MELAPTPMDECPGLGMKEGSDPGSGPKQVNDKII